MADTILDTGAQPDPPASGFSDTGDLWWDMTRTGTFLGKDYEGSANDQRAVQDWVARHDVAHPAPREVDGVRIGGYANRVWSPALKAELAGNKALAEEERAEMRILGPRLFES